MKYLKIEKMEAGSFVSAISFFFFGIGFIIDTIKYLQSQMWFLLGINIPVLLFLLIGVVFLLRTNKNWRWILVVFFLLIEINLILSVTYRAVHHQQVTLCVLTDMLLGLVIVAISGYVLKPFCTYLYSVLLSGGYVFVAFYTHDPFLLSNVILIPSVLIGTALCTHGFIFLYRKSEQKQIQSQDEILRLQQLIVAEKEKVCKSIDSFNKAIDKKTGNDPNKLKEMLRPLSNSLPEMVLEYSQKVSAGQHLFFNRLLKKHPQLTSSELKLSCMLVDNMTTKEIAEKTSCTVNSVKVFRSRLRTKLGLNSKDNLVTYLKSIEMEALV